MDCHHILFLSWLVGLGYIQMMLRQHERDIDQLGFTQLSCSTSVALRVSVIGWLQCWVPSRLRALKSSPSSTLKPSTVTELLKYPICFIPFYKRDMALSLKKILNICQVNSIFGLSVPLDYFPCTVLND